MAGDLRATTAPYTTSEGRDVTLNIYVRPGDEAKTDVTQSQQIIKQVRSELEEVLKLLRR